MKIWSLETTITTEDEYDEAKVWSQIDRDLNRGDGIYMIVKPRDTREKSSLKFIKEVADE